MDGFEPSDQEIDDNGPTEQQIEEMEIEAAIAWAEDPERLALEREESIRLLILRSKGIERLKQDGLSFRIAEEVYDGMTRRERSLFHISKEN